LKFACFLGLFFADLCFADGFFVTFYVTFAVQYTAKGILGAFL